MEQKMPEEMNIEELIEAMDEDAKRIGLTIADLYRTVTTAMAELPDMELHTAVISLSVNDCGITVHIGNPHRRRGEHDDFDDFDDDFDDDLEDEEEGTIYDEF